MGGWRRLQPYNFLAKKCNATFGFLGSLSGNTAVQAGRWACCAETSRESHLSTISEAKQRLICSSKEFLAVFSFCGLDGC